MPKIKVETKKILGTAPDGRTTNTEKGGHGKTPGRS